MSRIIEAVEINTSVKTENGDVYLVYTHSPFRESNGTQHNYYMNCQSLYGSFMFSRIFVADADGAIKQHYEMCNNLEEYIAKELADGDATL